jgi:hypothetical protein
MRAYDSVTFYFDLYPRPFRLPCAFPFLLLPVHENNDAAEARLSLYPAATDAHRIIVRSALYYRPKRGQ